MLCKKASIAQPLNKIINPRTAIANAPSLESGPSLMLINPSCPSYVYGLFTASCFSVWEKSSGLKWIVAPLNQLRTSCQNPWDFLRTVFLVDGVVEDVAGDVVWFGVAVVVGASAVFVPVSAIGAVAVAVVDTVDAVDVVATVGVEVEGVVGVGVGIRDLCFCLALLNSSRKSGVVVVAEEEGVGEADEDEIGCPSHPGCPLRIHRATMRISFIDLSSGVESVVNVSELSLKLELKNESGNEIQLIR